METHYMLQGRSGIRRETMFDFTVNYLTDLVSGGNLSPGDKLPSERELVEQLKVSRSVLREALRVLESQGLVSILQGKGVYVREPGLDTAIQPVQRLLQHGSITFGNLMQARRMIEPEIARLASLNIQDDQRERLQQLYEEMVKYLRYPERYVQADKNFHSYLAVCSGNPVFSILIWPIITMFAGFIELLSETPGTPEIVITAHGDILAAVKNRDPNAAETAMRLHLDAVEERFKKYTGKTFFPERTNPE